MPAGHFNIPYGNYKNPYFPEKEIRAFAEKAQRATFICASFARLMSLSCSISRWTGSRDSLKK
ncbi:DNA adenine methylase [Bacillus sp. SS-TM]